MKSAFMRNKAWLITAILFTISYVTKAQTASTPQLDKNSIKEVIAAMTLEEKVRLLVGTGRAPKPKSAGPGVSNGWVPEPPMIGYTETKVPGAAGNTAAIPRLGIPSLVMSDGPAGVRISPRHKGDSTNTYYATAFPVGTLLASTWDTALVETVGRAFGNEVKEYGVGLSYTDFAISNLKLNSNVFKEKITATVTVRNTGKVTGREVVQVYVSAPAKAIDKPEQELKAFAKTRLLQPGESQLITFTINAADLASFHTGSSAWITEPGKYMLKVGSSSRSIKQTAVFSVPRVMIVEKNHKVLQPDINITELKAKN